MKDHEGKAERKAAGSRFAGTDEIGFGSRIPRAHRYEIGTVMRYRIRGQQEWREGLMKNISISGVLIRAADFVAPDTAIEMRFFLPVHLEGQSAAEVVCRGSIVRSSKCNEMGEAAMVAARINHSRFLRQRERREQSPRFLSIEGFLKS